LRDKEYHFNWWLANRFGVQEVFGQVWYQGFAVGQESIHPG
jgi:hypothetical protein